MANENTQVITLENLATFKQIMLDAMYPIGSIYMSVNSTSPATLFGGTWEQLENRFLLGAGSSYTAGDTGGSDQHRHNLANSAFAKIGLVGGSNPKLAYKELQLGSGSKWAREYEIGVNSYTASSSETGFGTMVDGTTNYTTTLPPYLVVYMWKRVS